MASDVTEELLSEQYGTRCRMGMVPLLSTSKPDTSAAKSQSGSLIFLRKMKKKRPRQIM